MEFSKKVQECWLITANGSNHDILCEATRDAITLQSSLKNSPWSSTLFRQIVILFLLLLQNFCNVTCSRPSALNRFAFHQFFISFSSSYVNSQTLKWIRNQVLFVSQSHHGFCVLFFYFIQNTLKANVPSIHYPATTRRNASRKSSFVILTMIVR